MKLFKVSYICEEDDEKIHYLTVGEDRDTIESIETRIRKECEPFNLYVLYIKEVDNVDGYDVILKKTL